MTDTVTIGGRQFRVGASYRPLGYNGGWGNLVFLGAVSDWIVYRRSMTSQAKLCKASWWLNAAGEEVRP